MNCDEAFDALTDPNAQHNSALKWHLDFCPRCREMQQVLAPALAMFSAETDLSQPPAEETGASPSHRLPAEFLDSSAKPQSAGPAKRTSAAPFLTPEAVRVAEQTAKSLHPARSRSAAHWQRWVAVGLLCLLAVWGAFFISLTSNDPPSSRQSDPVMLADQCLWTNRNTDHLAAGPSEQPSSRWVVLSCVACHLEQSLE